MLLSRGYSPELATLTMGLVYAPLLLTAVPAGAACDHTDPRWMMRTSNAIALVACAAYPLAVPAGHEATAASTGARGALREGREGEQKEGKESHNHATAYQRRAGTWPSGFRWPFGRTISTSASVAAPRPKCAGTNEPEPYQIGRAHV